MTDEEILAEVYKKLQEPVTKMPVEYRAWVWKAKLIEKFIEDEWKKRDDPDFVPTEGLKNEVKIYFTPAKKNIRNNGKHNE